MRTFIITAAVSLLAAGSAIAQQATPDQVAKAVAAAWKNLTPELQARVDQDTSMKICSETKNNPSKAQAEEIVKEAKAAIVYPADGKFMGDWKRGEALAQSGYGLRFTDRDTKRANGGNCYACHQLAPAEVSYGTIGPPLREYGKIRKYDEREIRALYEKIYNSHAAFACSFMPRFGTAGVLTIDQIKDIVALLMDPESPVNK